MKTDTKQAKNPEKQGEKSDVKLSLSSDVTQVREYTKLKMYSIYQYTNRAYSGPVMIVQFQWCSATKDRNR